MKVILVIPHLSDGGGERIVSDLSCSLQADELVLVVFQNKITYPFKGRVVSLEMPIERNSVLSRATGFIRRILLFRLMLQRERPDVVISFMGEANLINALLSPNPIVTVHNHLSSLAELVRKSAPNRIARMRKRFDATVSEILIRILYRRAIVVAVAETVKAELIERFRIPQRQVVVISNAVNVGEIQKKAAEPVDCPWAPDVPVVITAGRLTLQKGQWHLIRAFAEARKRLPCQLAILGAGELEDCLRGIAKELGVERDVYFLGWQANPFQFIAHANLFVLPSITEGFGLVLLEAMACGLPVVSTDCPGEPRGILAPGTVKNAVLQEPEYAAHGVLLAVAEERQLADVLVSMLRDQSLRERYAQAGLARVRDFDHSVFVAQYQQLIERTVGAVFDRPRPSPGVSGSSI